MKIVDQFTQDFCKWMDEHGLTARAVAQELNAEEQTIRNWRSQGVPKRRQPHLTLFMRNWSQLPQALTVAQNLVIHPSQEQWERWQQAAKATGETVTDWAINSLNQFAEEAFSEQTDTTEEVPTKKAS